MHTGGLVPLSSSDVYILTVMVDLSTVGTCLSSMMRPGTTAGGYLASVAAAAILVFCRIVSSGIDLRSMVGRNPIAFSSYPVSVFRPIPDIHTSSHSSFNDPIFSTSSSGIMLDRNLTCMFVSSTREIDTRQLLTPRK